MSDCSTVEVLERLLAGQLSEAEDLAVEAHIQDCPACQGILEALTAAPARSRTPIAASAEPARAAPAVNRLIDRRPRVIHDDLDGPDRDPTYPGSAAPELPAITGFEVLREVGRGGMGVVYEAIELALGRRVALKVLAASTAGPTAAARFRREARAAGRLHHTNIVPIFGVGSDGGLMYYAMQFIEGEGLDRLIERLRSERAGPARSRPKLEVGRLRPEPVPSPAGSASMSAPIEGSLLPPSSGALSLARARTVARIGLQVAEALDHAHHSGFLHRDIKPSNIMLDQTGTAWVADFGLAKSAESESEEALTHTGDIVGTLRYMPPERFDGRSDVRGDVYSLGATLYELLTLQPVFDEFDRTRLIDRVLSAEPIAPQLIDRRVPRNLETIVLKAMDKEPARRYAGASQLAEDLRRFLDGQTITARRLGAWERSARWARRRPVIAALCGVVILLGLSLLGLGTWSYIRIRRALEKADTALGIEARTRAEKERLSADLALDRGIALAEADQVGPGLLWMLRSLELAPPGAFDLRRAARSNLAAWLDQAISPKHIVLTGGPIERMALSPDGRTVVTGHLDGMLRSWDTTSGRLLGSVRANERLVLALAFRPDSRVVASGGHRFAPIIRLWDARSLRPIGHPMPHPVNTLVNVIFRPDSQVLLTHNRDDGMVRSWDATTGLSLAPPLLHPGVLCVAFSPDGRRLATAGRSRDARLWDVATGSPIGEPLPHRSIVAGIIFSPDGRQLATVNLADHDSIGASIYEGRLRIWDVATGRLVAAGAPFGSQLMPLVFHPDGQRFVAAGLHRLDQLDGAAIDSPIIRTEGARDLVVSPDGREILMTGSDGKIRLLDARSGRASGSIMEHEDQVIHAGFDPDGRSIVTAARAGSLQVRAGARGELNGRFLSHLRGVQTAEFSPDGRTLATASFDGTARIFEVATGQPCGPPMFHSSRVREARFRPDGKVLATSGDDDVVRLWDVATGRPIGLPLPHGHWVVHLRFSPDGRKLLTGRVLAQAKLWDLAVSPPRGVVLEHPGRIPGYEIWHGEFTRDGRIAITADGAGILGFWDAETGHQLGDFLRLSDGFEQFSLGRTGQDLIVLSGGRFHRIDCQTRREISTPFGEQINVMALSCDGQTLLSGGWDKVAQLWDPATGRTIGARMQHDTLVRGCSFSPDGTTLATVTDDGQVRFWDAVTGKPIGPTRGHAGWISPQVRQPLAFAPDGRTLLTAGNSVVIWPVPVHGGSDHQSLTALIPTLAGLRFDVEGVLRRLSPAEWSRALSGRTAEPANSSSLLAWHDRTAAQCEPFGPMTSALWHLDRLVNVRPDDAFLRARRARIHRLLGDPARAEIDELRAIANGPPGWLRAWQAHDLQDRATAAESLRDWDEALALLNRLVNAIGDHAGLRLRRGDVYARLGQWADAAADLDAALAASFPFNENLGRLFRRRQGRGGGPSEQLPLERMILYHLAAGDLDGYRAAVSWLRQQAPHAPDPRRDVFLVYLLTFGTGGADDPAETVRMAQAAAAGLPNEEIPWAQRYLGAALYRAGRHAEAVTRLEANKQDSAPWDWAFLAMVHYHLGDPVEARAWLDRLRAFRPDTNPSGFLNNLEVELLRREAEAVIRLDPAFPADPFAR